MESQPFYWDYELPPYPFGHPDCPSCRPHQPTRPFPDSTRVFYGQPECRKDCTGFITGWPSKYTIYEYPGYVCVEPPLGSKVVRVSYLYPGGGEGQTHPYIEGPYLPGDIAVAPSPQASQPSLRDLLIDDIRRAESKKKNKKKKNKNKKDKKKKKKKNKCPFGGSSSSSESESESESYSHSGDHHRCLSDDEDKPENKPGTGSTSSNSSGQPNPAQQPNLKQISLEPNPTKKDTNPKPSPIHHHHQKPKCQGYHSSSRDRYTPSAPPIQPELSAPRLSLEQLIKKERNCFKAGCRSGIYDGFVLNNPGLALKDLDDFQPNTEVLKYLQSHGANTYFKHWITYSVKKIVDSGIGIRAWAPKPLPISRVVVDFLSPTLGKEELSVGHFRTAVVADSIARLLEFSGLQVVRRHNIGAWGSRFGLVLDYLTLEYSDLNKEDLVPLVVEL